MRYIINTAQNEKGNEINIKGDSSVVVPNFR